MFESFKKVELASMFKHVKIDEEKIKSFVDNFNSDCLIIPKWNDEVFFIENSKRDVDFLFLVNTINFSYWPDTNQQKWTCNFANKTYSGSYGLFACMKKAIFEGSPLFSSNYLEKISEDDLRHILQSEVNEIPMLKERVRILREVGRTLNELGCNFSDIVPKAENSAIELINLIFEYFPCFRDIHFYKGNQFNFFKKAQLLCAMLYGRYEGKDFGRFDDIKELTIFADYRVPQMLRNLGLITYSDELSKKIDENIYFSDVNQEVSEIRASAIITSEILKNLINEKRGSDDVNSLHIDFFLWKTSKVTEEKYSNFHKTRSIYY